jgi:glutathione synthase
MRIAFFVNDVKTEVDEYTTTRFAMAAARHGHDVWYVGAGDIDYEPDESLRARGRSAEWRQDDDLSSFLKRMQTIDEVPHIVLEDFDAVMLRNDSIADIHERPWAVNAGVLFGQLLADRGVTVVNDPSSLSRASSKLYLQQYPSEIRPRSLVSRDKEQLKEFVSRLNGAALKPLYGAMGRNVFLIQDPEDANLDQMVESVLSDGYVIAQEFVPEAEQGDIRLFMLDGEPLEQDGAYAAVRRIPEGQDLRANISADGKPKEAAIGEVELSIASAMRDQLKRDGMFFVGVDIVGDQVVEINAESPGGLQSVEYFTGIDFAPQVIEALERRARKMRPGS